MDMWENLLSLEILRDFVRAAVSPRTYQRNLVIDRIETPNHRLWVLRERLQLDEAIFAERLHIDVKEYREYERIGSSVPRDVLEKVSRTFSVPIPWLCCENPLLPIPPTRNG